MSAFLALCLFVPLFRDAGSPTEAGQDDPAKQRLAALRKYYLQTAERYEFVRDSRERESLKLEPKPVMTWSTHNDWSGDVFVWTHAGRPEVIGCILSGPETADSRKAIQEFHLLGEEPISPVTTPGGVRWAPNEGLKLRSLEGAPEPAKTAALRLSQMRDMLRGFTAHMIYNERESHLRLLPQPLMRFSPADDIGVDGALFAYVWPDGGTDPEMLLLLECRRTEAGVAWFYAAARFSTRELWLKHRDEDVWRVPPRDGQAELSLPYLCGTIELIPQIPPEGGYGAGRTK